MASMLAFRGAPLLPGRVGVVVVGYGSARSQRKGGCCFPAGSGESHLLAGALGSRDKEIKRREPGGCWCCWGKMAAGC